MAPKKDRLVFTIYDANWPNAKGDKNGGNRRTSQKSKGSPANKSNQGTRGSGTAGTNQGTNDSNSPAAQGANQRTGVNLVPLNYWISNDDLYSYINTNMGKTPSGKWCPPWMSGELAKPNAAKTWIPRDVPKKSEGIIAGEIIAWRAWYWDKERKRLRSIFVDYEWPTDGPAIGKPGAGYGIHAFKEADRVWEEYRLCISHLVCGQVALWGDVVEFEQGYTAEFAKIVSMHICPGYAKKAIKELYLAGSR